MGNLDDIRKSIVESLGAMKPKVSPQGINESTSYYFDEPIHREIWSGMVKKAGVKSRKNDENDGEHVVSHGGNHVHTFGNTTHIHGVTKFGRNWPHDILDRLEPHTGSYKSEHELDFEEESTSDSDSKNTLAESEKPEERSAWIHKSGKILKYHNAYGYPAMDKNIKDHPHIASHLELDKNKKKLHKYINNRPEMHAYSKGHVHVDHYPKGSHPYVGDELHVHGPATHQTIEHVKKHFGDKDWSHIVWSQYSHRGVSDSSSRTKEQFMKTTHPDQVILNHDQILGKSGSKEHPDWERGNVQSTRDRDKRKEGVNVPSSEYPKPKGLSLKFN